MNNIPANVIRILDSCIGALAVLQADPDSFFVPEVPIYQDKLISHTDNLANLAMSQHACLLDPAYLNAYCFGSVDARTGVELFASNRNRFGHYALTALHRRSLEKYLTYMHGAPVRPSCPEALHDGFKLEFTRPLAVINSDAHFPTPGISPYHALLQHVSIMYQLAACELYPTPQSLKEIDEGIKMRGEPTPEPAKPAEPVIPETFVDEATGTTCSPSLYYVFTDSGASYTDQGFTSVEEAKAWIAQSEWKDLDVEVPVLTSCSTGFDPIGAVNIFFGRDLYLHNIATGANVFKMPVTL